MTECGALRNTKQKALILDCLRESGEGHVTAEEIIDFLKAKGPPVAKSTVYRYLLQLEESGEVRKYLLAEGTPACYQFIGESGPCLEHYHLMCQSCGQIVHFEDAELQKFFGRMQEKAGFHIDGSRTVFYGLCGSCLEGVETREESGR